MRIAVFHNLRSSGGAKRALVEMVRQLRLRGHTVDAFLPATADERFLPLDTVVDSVRVWPIDGWALPPGTGPVGAAARAPAFVRAMRRAAAVERHIAAAIDAGGYDVAFVNHGRYTQAPWLLLYLRTPSAFFCQEPLRDAYEAEDRPGLRRRMRLWAPRVGWAQIDRDNVAAATAILANSYYSRESILRAYGRDAIVVHLGVNDEQFRPGPPRRPRIVLSVGALHPRKGHELAIDAVGLIAAERRPSLVVVADRGLDNERERLERHAATAQVDLTVQMGISEEELAATYQRAALLLCAAHLEPFGLVTLEAAATGTPVIALREGGLRETVVDGVTGLLVDTRSAGLMAEAADRLLTDPNRWETFSRASVDWVQSNWTWSHVGERLEIALKSVAAGELNIAQRKSIATDPQ